MKKSSKPIMWGLLERPGEDYMRRATSGGKQEGCEGKIGLSVGTIFRVESEKAGCVGGEIKEEKGVGALVERPKRTWANGGEWTGDIKARRGKTDRPLDGT